jgi:hypothetical protein
MSHLRIFQLYLRHQHYWWRVAKFWLMFSAQGLWAGRDFYHATPAVTRGLGFSCLIRTTPYNRLLWLPKGCGGPILTRTLTGSHSVSFYNTQDLFLPGSSWVHWVWNKLRFDCIENHKNQCCPQKSSFLLDIEI